MTGPRKVSSQVRKLNQGAAPRNSLRAAYIQAIQTTAGEVYRPQQASASLVRMDNAKHALHAELDSSGPSLRQTAGSDSTHSAAFHLVRYGCEGTEAGAVQASHPVARGQRVVYSRGDVTEWYHNGPLGVEQGFDLRARPACVGSGAIELELDVQTDLKPVLVGSSDSPSIDLRDEQGKPLFHYTDLSAFDADGKVVPAKMALAGNKIVLRVDDRSARYPLHVDPLIWSQVGGAIKGIDDLAGTSVAGDKFGTAIAVSGDTAVVGAPFCDDAADDAGAGFIFTRTAPGQWVQQVELTVGDVPGIHLGKSVAITDIGGGMKRVVLGAPDDSGDGTASWWKGSAATWTYEQTQGPVLAAGSRLGTAVAVSGDRVVIGAPGYNTDDGFVSFIELVGANWIEVFTATATAGSKELLGSSVGIDGTLAVAGAPHRVNVLLTNAGGYDSFVRIAGTWGLGASMKGMAANLLGGSALAMSGTTVINGAPGFATNTGTAFADTLNAATGLVLTSLPLAANGLSPGDMYGSTVAVDDSGVALSGILAVVGTSAQATNTGNAYVWRGVAGVWTLDPASAVNRTTAPTAGEFFGASVAVNAKDPKPFILVGAPGNGTPADSGAFYEFIRRGQNGDPCGPTNGDLECVSNFCVDGVCCESACGRIDAANNNDGDCMACTLGTGKCDPARPNQVCNAQTPNGCDSNALCQSGSTVCPPKPLKSAGTVCRTAAGVCDLPEICDGIVGTCPATDAKLPNGTICRAAAGLCDLPETCDGTSNGCPAVDAKQPSTFVCRAAAGLCDLAETCNGGNNCPADAIAAAGTSCRSAKDECDMAEACDGATVGCPLDSARIDGASCSAGSCQIGICRVEAELALTFAVNLTHTTLQNPVTVTATIQNNGPSPATQVQIQFASNDGATLQNAAGTGFTCQTGQGVTTCTGADLAPGASVMLTLTAIPPFTKGNFSVSGIATSVVFDPITSNNTATVVVTNDNPQTPGLGGGGFGCSLLPGSRTPAAPGLFTLALAMLGLLIRRRRLA